MRIVRGNRTRRKPAPVPLCSPQIPHGLSWDGTRTAAVGSRRLTAWAMTRPGVGWSSTEKGQVVNICSEASWLYKVAGTSWPAECLSRLWTVATDSDNTFLGGSHSNTEQAAYVSAMLSGSLEFTPADATDRQDNFISTHCCRKTLHSEVISPQNAPFSCMQRQSCFTKHSLSRDVL
jgi:hypothetical protein